MRSIAYPDGWFYVERASVLMFWLVGQIDPELDTMTVGVPYVHAAGDAAADARGGGGELVSPA